MLYVRVVCLFLFVISVVFPGYKLACVGSVSVEFPRKFRCFGRAKIKAFFLFSVSP